MMKKAILSIAAFAVSAVLLAGPTTPKTATQKAAQEADKSGPLAESVWGFCAVNLQGDTLAWLNAGRRMLPASNMKLITTGAALLTFGGNHTFQTTLAFRPRLEKYEVPGPVAVDSVLRADLYVVGGGDPMIGNLFSYMPKVDVTFGKWLKVLEDNGIKVIDGDVVGDGSAFLGELRHTDWSTEDVRTRDGVVPSGLTWRGKMGDPIPDGPYPAVLHFKEWLKTHSDISITGKAREGHADSLTVLGSVNSLPLRSLVRTANCMSDNFIAETLLKALGDRYYNDETYSRSISALHRALSQLGLMSESGQMRFADGSGLSRKNYVSPAFMVKYLKAMTRSRVYDDFLASLPYAGEKGTTLERRLPGADASLKKRIRMKSGSMNGTRCFSGYILPGDGVPQHAIVFSILTNNAVASNADTYAVIDSLVEALAKENK